MATVNYGRVRPTPPHVQAHDNPVPVITVGGLVSAAWGSPGGGSPGGKSPGLGGLVAPKPAPGIGDFGKKGDGKRPKKHALPSA